MSMMDDDVGEAIDTGNDSQQAPAPSPAPPISTDNSQGQPPTQLAQQPEPNQLPNMGPPPVGQEMAQETPGEGMQKAGQAISTAAGQGVQNFQQSGPAQAGKRIIALLAGEGAENPAALDQIAAKVDPQGKMSPADRQVVAIHQAAQTQGPEAAAAILQANRVAYGSKAAFAYTALQGTQGKPADLNAAIKAANQAQENLPDGSNVIFSPGGAGQVIAVASLPGSKKTIQYNLSTQQFGQFLDVGKDGQFDQMMNISAPGMLQKLTQVNASGAPQQPQGQTQQGQPKDQSQGGGNWMPTSDEIDAVKKQDADKAAGVKPGMSDEEAQNARDEAAQEAKWGKQALQRFPWASQANLREDFIAKQRDQSQNNQNKIDVAGETGKAKIKVAEATGRSRVDAATTTANAKRQGWEYASDAKREIAAAALQRAMVQEQGKNGRSAEANQMGLIKKKIETGQPLTDDDNALAKKYGAAADKALSQTPAAARAPQAATPQANSAAQTRPAGVPPDAKLYQGKWYTRGASGEAVPVQ